jgi:CRISPR/Cas system-associated endoribonuclease Cas2
MLNEELCNDFQVKIEEKDIEWIKRLTTGLKEKKDMIRKYHSCKNCTTY